MILINHDNPFKWRHYQGDIILLCVRWYLRYRLSYRDLAEMMRERGLTLDHSTIYRWVQAYAPELEKRTKRQLKSTNDSWRVDETYVKVRGQWMYLYRALDSAGNTLDFLLCATRSRRSAKRFFRKVSRSDHVCPPWIINVDKDAAYPSAIAELKAERVLPAQCQRRPSRYMNNVIEQDHRFLKWVIRAGMGFRSYPTAWRTIQGYETMHMIRKGQVRGVPRSDVLAQVQFVQRVFGLVA